MTLNGFLAMWHLLTRLHYQMAVHYLHYLGYEGASCVQATKYSEFSLFFRFFLNCSSYFIAGIELFSWSEFLDPRDPER